MQLVSVVVHCPFCDALGLCEARLSGNNFGGKHYTDGKDYTDSEPLLPMAMRVPSVVQCRACSQPFWQKLATTVGSFDPWSKRDYDDDGQPIDPTLRDTPSLYEPTEEQYLKGLGELIKSVPEEELSIRTLAWWRGNDRFRESDGGPSALDMLIYSLQGMDDPRATELLEAAIAERDALNEVTDNVHEANPSSIDLMRQENIDALLRLLPEEDSTCQSKLLMRAEVLRQMGEFDKALAILARPYPEELSGPIARLSSLCREKDSMLRTF